MALPVRIAKARRNNVIHLPKAGQRDRPWLAGEESRVIEMRLDRKTIPQVAKALHRTPSSIENKWLELRRRDDLPRVRGRNIADPISHFWARVDMTGGPDACWPWNTRSRYPSGYGALCFDMGEGRRVCGAHRVAFFIANRRRPAPKFDVMHSCDNKLCCNPSHLSEGTRQQNMRDAHNRGLIRKKNPQKGTACHFAVLDERRVAAIRRLIACGATQRDVAQAAGVSIPAIAHIVSGRTWKAVA